MLIPFDYKGNLLHYPERIRNPETNAFDDPLWRESEPFFAMISDPTAIRGRSAAYFVWTDWVRQVTYPMFLTDINKLLLETNILKGQCAAWFEPSKRGKNYGIRLWRGAPQDW